MDEEIAHSTAQTGFSSSVTQSGATFPAGEGKCSLALATDGSFDKNSSKERKTLYRPLINATTLEVPLLVVLTYGEHVGMPSATARGRGTNECWWWGSLRVVCAPLLASL